MKYETPELTALTPAIDAIQVLKHNGTGDGSPSREPAISAYEDWED
jgi:hypothetical protein